MLKVAVGDRKGTPPEGDQVLDRSGSARLLLLFGVLSLGAVSIGAVVCAMSGVPTSLWAGNLAAWLAGALAAAGIAATDGRRALPLILWSTPALLAAVFPSQGQDGVHRWVDAGPVSVNVAMVVLPAAVVALAGLCRAGRWPWLPALACLGVLVVQPDASQATAFGLAMVLVATVCTTGPLLRAAVIVASTGLVIAAWLRPDPLQPVPEVEDIIELAYALSPLHAGLAVALLIGAALAPVMAAMRPRDLWIAGGALSALFVIWVVIPFLGHYPVPLVGVGISPVLGSWLAVGLLAGLIRRAAAAADQSGPAL